MKKKLLLNISQNTKNNFQVSLVAVNNTDWSVVVVVALWH